jgi:UDP-glucose 4-epimerase
VRLLVTGGAGYVGSAVGALLVAEGHDVTVLDDLSTGHQDAVPAGATFVRGTLRDDAARLLAGGVDAVLHFAAKSLVGESMAQPSLYWESNLGGSLALLEAMRAAGTPRIVFSSTAAVYGEPEQVPIEETAPTRPTSPYGGSKVAVDTALSEYARMQGVGAVSLRYFNVAGAHEDTGGQWYGERHSPETHLIPNVLKIALPKADTPKADDAGGDGPAGAVKIFGDDYPTPDGTCVRDYIHVADLAQAHVLALGATEPGQHRVYNLGNGTGFSVRQVVDVCREVTGVDIPAELAPRREGDPAVLVASSERIRTDLGWRATRDLPAMVADAWTFGQQTARNAAQPGAGAR